MGYYELDANLQNIVLLNYEQFAKSFLIFIIFAIALIYKFYWKEYRQKITPYLGVGVMRFLLGILSSVVLVYSPFFIFFFNPAYTLGKFGVLFTTLYGVGVVIFMVVFSTDYIRLGVFGIAKLVGLDIKDPTVNEYLKRIKKFSLVK